MNRKLMALCGLAAVFTVGCEDESAMNGTPAVMDAGHNHDEAHAHAETLEEAVEELIGLRNAIRDGFAKDDADAAHGPLHEIGHVYSEIEKFAEADLETDQLNAVRDALETLKESLNSVDAMMHGKEGSEYSEVAEKVDAAVAVLAEASGADPDGHAHEGSHEEHGEEGHKHDEDGEGHHEEDGHGHDKDGEGHHEEDGDHGKEHKDGEKDHDEDHKDGDHDDDQK